MAKEYIDREKFKLEYLCCGYLPEMSEEKFDEFPAADAVEVVRCNVCVNYNTYNCSSGFGWCENLGIGVHDSFFCKVGERKEGAKNE